MPRSTDAQQLRRSKLQCCRPARAEQFTAAPATRHELCAFQASTENISIWELVNHDALWLFAVLRLRNTLTYLLTYTHTHHVYSAVSCVQCCDSVGWVWCEEGHVACRTSHSSNPQRLLFVSPSRTWPTWNDVWKNKPAKPKLKVVVVGCVALEVWSICVWCICFVFCHNFLCLFLTLDRLCGRCDLLAILFIYLFFICYLFIYFLFSYFLCCHNILRVVHGF